MSISRESVSIRCCLQTVGSLATQSNVQQGCDRWAFCRVTASSPQWRSFSLPPAGSASDGPWATLLRGLPVPRDGWFPDAGLELPQTRGRAADFLVHSLM